MLRALFDPATGKTYVRHPSSEDENEWIETSLLGSMKKGSPVSTVSDSCEVVILECSGKKQGAESVRLSLLQKGTRPMIR